MRARLQHHFNALHVYCRMCEFYVPKKLARRFSRIYEKIVHPFLYV